MKIKIGAILLSAVMMLSSMCVLGVYALENDYVPGAVPTNYYTNGNDLNGIYKIGEGTNLVSFDAARTWSGFDIQALKAINAANRAEANLTSVPGITPSQHIAEKAAGGTAYVVSCAVRRVIDPNYPDAVPQIGVSLSNGAGMTSFETIEYGTAGLKIESEDWTEFKATIILPGNSTYTEYTPILIIGLADGTPQGAKIEINIEDNILKQFYAAKEVAYDITNTPQNSEPVGRGSSKRFSAAIINQLGLKGTVKQGSFDWSVVDSNGNIQADFTVTPDAATESAMVKVPQNAEEGTYYVKVQSAEYKMQKTAEFTVSANYVYTNYLPGAMPTNYYTNGNDLNGIYKIGEGTNLVSFDAARTWAGFDIQALKEVNSVNRVAANLTSVPGLSPSQRISQKATGETAYVVSCAARRVIDPDYPDAVPQIGVSLNNGAGATEFETLEYGTSGLRLESEEWINFKATIVLPGNPTYAEYTPTFVIGLADGTPEGAKAEINIKRDSVQQYYAAKEVAYNINADTANGERSFAVGETINVTAAVVNQIDKEGTLEQSFTWHVLDANKNEIKSGVNLNLTNNGKNAELCFTEKRIGKCYIVAFSEKYDMARFIEIELTDPTLTEHIPGEKPANLIKQPGTMEFYSDSTHPDIEVNEVLEYKKRVAVSLKTSSEVEDVAAYYKNRGIAISLNTETNIQSAGQTAFVFSADVKNTYGMEGIKLAAGLSNNSYSSAALPVEYPSGEALIATGDEIQKIRATMIMPGREDTLYKPLLTFGFALGTKADSSFEISLDRYGCEQMYFAPEVPYDIYNKITKGNSCVKAGDTVELETGVINQIGTLGSLAQNFDWYVKNPSGGFDKKHINEVLDNNKYTISFSETAESGIYHIFAVSKDYPQLVRMTEITVYNNDHILYVSPYGSDTNIGNRENPLNSLEGAVAKIIALAKRGINVKKVIFSGGEYRFSKSAVINENLGFPKNVEFCAEAGAEVVFKGSVPISLDKASVISDKSISERLLPDMENKVICVDLKSQGILESDICDTADTNGMYLLVPDGEFNALYIDGVEQPIAQWPDTDHYSTRGESIGDNTFVYTDENCDRWQNAKNWWVSAFTPYDYSRFRFSVKSLDTQANTITVTDTPAEKITAERSKRWKAFNLLEEISQPGEFYIDRDSLMLYFYPPYDVKNAKAELSLFSKPLIHIQNADGIKFDGITFAQTRSHAVQMLDVKNITFNNCKFRDISADGINSTGTQTANTGSNTWQVQKKLGSSNVAVRGCDFYNIGRSAVNLGGGGDIDTLTSSGNIIENNFISKTAVKSFWEPIIIGGCGTVVKNNNISNCPAQAIRPWGNDHIIEYNEIYNCLTEDADCGVIYWGGSQIFQGTTVKYNYIHDVKAHDDKLAKSQVGIYWDDCQIGQSAMYNIIVNTPIDFNSNGAGATRHMYNTSVNTRRTLALLNHINRENEIVTNNTFNTMEEVKNDIRDLPLFYKRYSYLEDVLNGTNPKKYTVVKGNLSVNAQNVSIGSQDERFAAISNNTQLAECSDFVDAANQDYRLKSDSELAKQNPNLLNDSNFDIEKIGLLNDRELNSKTAKFKLIYPLNGEKIKLTDGATLLSWQAAVGANSYKLTIASDSDFNNVVFEKETPYTWENVTGLLNDSVYYWKVSAKNISRELAAEWENQGGTHFFSTADYVQEVLISALNVSDKGEVSFNVEYNAGESTLANIYIAYYDNKNQLVYVECISATLTRGLPYPVSGKEMLSEYSYIKIFVWKNNLSPFSGGFINLWNN